MTSSGGLEFYQATTGTMCRSYAPDLEVKSGGDGRTVYGIAVPYQAPMRINDNLVEQFRGSAVAGPFDHQFRAATRVKYANEHVMLGGTLVGAMNLMRNDARGLYVELRVSKTPKGDETLELVRDGALTDLSVMFRERQNARLPGGVVERVTADLIEVASVFQGAYGELATAAGVRSIGGSVGMPMAAELLDLRSAAEKYLVGGLPDLPDLDTAIKATAMGLPVPPLWK